MGSRLDVVRLAVFGFLPAIGACHGSSPAGAGTGTTPPAAAADAPAPTGKVVVIQLIADGAGSRFDPANVTVKRGDILRFTLSSGVHNVDFLADSNPGVPNLPAPSDALQLPQQTYDVPVNFPAGHTYYFQCDPHAALGMRGHVTVQ